ncbi:hypothetical protein Sdia_11550 [Streptomyces diastaticus subsp. diastaticus]|uniref:Uncharacterized protein n=1 Tax=Streptomyces diastaticus subsp. diastaticus TaxID=68040 RepID=A0ABQ1CJ20_STRDI|nr:hypothetical protein Sdia_11550 [Streptomyces diastaticus subsp. diastaticus]GGU17112.1 hypothetical protein GCM10015534_20000 [Streptomyces diastaticus subsp. diastaticus]
MALRDVRGPGVRATVRLAGVGGLVLIAHVGCPLIDGVAPSSLGARPLGRAEDWAERVTEAGRGAPPAGGSGPGTGPGLAGGGEGRVDSQGTGVRTGTGPGGRAGPRRLPVRSGAPASRDGARGGGGRRGPRGRAGGAFMDPGR